MAKKTQAQVNKKEQDQRDAFWEDVLKLEEKHGVVLSAFLEYTQRGIIPVIGSRVKTEEEKKKDE